MAGRKTKLTKEVQDQIIKRIKAGCYTKVACRSVGIGESTYYEWIKRGEAGEYPFSEFTELIRQAEAEGEVMLVASISSHIRKDWRAALEILARKYPDRWGKREYLKVNQEDTFKNKKLSEMEELMKDVPKEEVLKIAHELGNKLIDTLHKAKEGKELGNIPNAKEL